MSQHEAAAPAGAPAAAGREEWGSRQGFVLATLGSAIGLGNIWRFSYVAGDNGGGAFLLVYLVAVLLIGLPLMLAELALGRHGQGDVVQAFARVAPRHGLARRVWHGIALALVAGAVLILSYYAVVAGWTLRYFIDYLGARTVADGHGADEHDHAAAFTTFIAHPWAPVLWQAGFLALTVAVVLGGVRRGIEAANRILLPLLGMIVVGLALYSLSLPGAMRGVRFLLQPDWAALAEPRVYLAALGQAFFSLGLSMGVMATYGGYLSRRHRLPGAAVSVATGDSLFAIIAGLAIFPAVFALGLAPSQGPTLAFVVLPQVFAGMPGGAWFGLAFFALLAAAALTSAISLLEVAVAYAVRRHGIARARAAFGLGLATFLLGVPSALGFGVLSGVRILGHGIFDAIDTAVSAVLLPVAGIAFAVLVGWVWPRQAVLDEADMGGHRLAGTWLLLLRYVVPVVIGVILLRALGLL
jgi:NSS family neurotransmitter:Na+ symporter